MTVPDGILEYGSLGVLVLVLGAVGVWLKWYTRETQAFIRDLVDKRDVNIAEERADWKELVRSSTEAQSSTAAALDQIAQELRQISSRQGENVATLREGQDTIITRMRLEKL